jgi:hypothetical protein
MKTLVIITFMALAWTSQALELRGEQYVVVEGDIAKFKRYVGDKAAPNPRKLYWKENLIPWEINRGEEKNLSLVNTVKRAIEHLSKKTNLRFVERTTEKDYVSFTAKNRGCYSFVGRVRGKQPINLSKGCWYTMTAVHEIFHAAGMEHEQCRHDRDKYIKVLDKNIESSMIHNFTKERGASHGSYDIKSIMHYGSWAFSKNGKPTMLTKRNKTFYQNRQYLTKGDILGINSIYPSLDVFDIGKVELFMKKLSGEAELSLSTNYNNKSLIDYVEYRLNMNDFRKLDGWKIYLPLDFGKKKLTVKFYLKDLTVEEKSWEFFLLDKKPKLTCSLWAKKNKSDSFEVPISFEKDKMEYTDLEFQRKLAVVSAYFHPRSGRLELNTELTERKGLFNIGKYQRNKHVLKGPGKIEEKYNRNTKLTCELSFKN